jgi:hypothetical protein
MTLAGLDGRHALTTVGGMGSASPLGLLPQNPHVTLHDDGSPRTPMTCLRGADC